MTYFIYNLSIILRRINIKKQSYVIILIVSFCNICPVFGVSEENIQIIEDVPASPTAQALQDIYKNKSVQIKLNKAVDKWINNNWKVSKKLYEKYQTMAPIRNAWPDMLNEQEIEDVQFSNIDIIGALYKDIFWLITFEMDVSYTIDDEIFHTQQGKERLICETWSIIAEGDEPYLVLIDCVFSFAGKFYITPYNLILRYGKIGLWE